MTRIYDAQWAAAVACAKSDQPPIGMQVHEGGGQGGHEPAGADVGGGGAAASGDGTGSSPHYRGGAAVNGGGVHAAVRRAAQLWCRRGI